MRSPSQPLTALRQLRLLLLVAALALRSQDASLGASRIAMAGLPHLCQLGERLPTGPAGSGLPPRFLPGRPRVPEMP